MHRTLLALFEFLSRDLVNILKHTGEVREYTQKTNVLLLDGPIREGGKNPEPLSKMDELNKIYQGLGGGGGGNSTYFVFMCLP